MLTAHVMNEINIGIIHKTESHIGFHWRYTIKTREREILAKICCIHQTSGHWVPIKILASKQVSAEIREKSRYTWTVMPGLVDTSRSRNIIKLCIQSSNLQNAWGYLCEYHFDHLPVWRPSNLRKHRSKPPSKCLFAIQGSPRQVYNVSLLFLLLLYSYSWTQTVRHLIE